MNNSLLLSFKYCSLLTPFVSSAACYVLEYSKKGLPYVLVLMFSDWPLPTPKPLASMPSTVATIPRLAKPANPASPSMKHRLHAQMVTEFMGEIERVQMDYASCAGKCSCTKSGRNLVWHDTRIFTYT